MDIDYAAGRITSNHADALIAAPHIHQQLGGKIGVGSKVTVIQEGFGKVFNEGPLFLRDGSQFDVLFEDGDTYMIGEMQCVAISAPGHTPACMMHVMGDATFVGDTLFMPESGTARADFPGGDAGILYDSIQKIFMLPDAMRLFMCHDYGQGGREIRWETNVAEEKAQNIHVGGGKSRENFIRFRTERDAQLDMPRLIIPSLQVNMRAGDVPTDADGNLMLKVPINSL